jgi:hypothetical protein
MKKMKKTLAVVIAISMLTSWSASCYASDNAFKDTFESAFYGGLVGTLVGGALLAFTKRPGDHLDYLAYGGAGGVLVGAGFGIIRSAKSLAEYENGKVKFAIPTIIPELRETGFNGQTALSFNAQLIRGKF